MRFATRTSSISAIPVAVGIILDTRQGHEDPKATPVTRMATTDTRMAPTATTVTVMAVMATTNTEDGDRGRMPVISNSFDTPQQHEGPTATTVTKMAIPTIRIPVSVDVVDTAQGQQGPKGTDSYEDGGPWGV